MCVYATYCMAMQSGKNYRALSGRFAGGLLSVLPGSGADRGEPVRRGSDNRCYGKSGEPSLGLCGFFGAPLHSLHQLCMTIFSAEILR